VQPIGAFANRGLSQCSLGNLPGGSQPARSDDLYRRFEINRETGRLATVFTPPELVEERVFLVVPPEAQEWSRLAELPVPPADYDTIQLPQPDPAAKISSPAQFSYVHGKIKVLGTAAGENFASYSLQLGKGINPAAWQTVGAPSTTSVEDGLLGKSTPAGWTGCIFCACRSFRPISG